MKKRFYIRTIDYLVEDRFNQSVENYLLNNYDKYVSVDGFDDIDEAIAVSKTMREVHGLPECDYSTVVSNNSNARLSFIRSAKEKHKILDEIISKYTKN